MPISEHDRLRVREVKERVEDELLAIPGVTGVDIDEKLSGGLPTGVAAIVVFVAEKKAPESVPPDEFVPAVIDGVPTDVRELKVVLQDDRP